jgi:methylmalonyl-CoA carboxyltransferase small subunit
VKLKVTIDGKVYEVDVDAEPEQSRPPTFVTAAPILPSTSVSSAPTPAVSTDSGVVDESKVCRSPVAGIVVKVAAQVGQSIQTNDVLMVLEAMKMETAISSPISGKVAKVNVAVGDPVQGGQVVVAFE